MGARAEVVIRRGRQTLRTSAVINSGFESAEPEIVLPEAAARRLGLWPKLPKGAAVEAYRTVAGRSEMVYIPRAVRTRLYASKSRPFVVCGATISESEEEVILNDQAAGALRIEILDLARGHWRVKGERKTRLSAPLRYWR